MPSPLTIAMSCIYDFYLAISNIFYKFINLDCLNRLREICGPLFLFAKIFFPPEMLPHEASSYIAGVVSFGLFIRLNRRVSLLFLAKGRGPENS
jgi:hypothetical protein